MLAAMAIPAGQTQVFQDVVASGANVVNLHRLPAICFTGLAVFTAAMGVFIGHLLEGMPRQFTHASPGSLVA